MQALRKWLLAEAFPKASPIWRGSRLVVIFCLVMLAITIAYAVLSPPSDAADLMHPCAAVSLPQPTVTCIGMKAETCELKKEVEELKREVQQQACDLYNLKRETEREIFDIKQEMITLKYR